MDFPENNDIRLALEQAEAEHRLATATLPDRLCEDWRFGRPHKHAAAMAELAESADNAGTVTVEGADDALCEPDDDARDSVKLMQSIGSDKFLALQLAHFGKGVVLFLERSYKEPITITYETEGTFLPTTQIVAVAGAKARIIERHICRGEKAAILCTRTIMAAEGAELSVELHEEGSGASRAMNITNITADGAAVRHLTTHSNHAWAREETVAEIMGAKGTDVQLYSANRLGAAQVLDQHTRQRHTSGGSTSNLLYKNVVDDKATAVFAGNIYVAPGAHDTDAYQSNRNMMLSEDATIHSLPGLEILADHVRCSHGSASAPMDEEQLFYLLSRGIPRHTAQLLVAEGFLGDVTSRFSPAEQD